MKITDDDLLAYFVLIEGNKNKSAGTSGKGCLLLVILIIITICCLSGIWSN